MRNEQLFEIAYSRPEDGMLPEAITAARSELATRDLAEGDSQELYQQTLDIQQTYADLANRPLPKMAWAIFMIFGVTIVGFVGAFGLFATGRKRMGKEAIYATIAGIAAAWALFLIIDLLT